MALRLEDKQALVAEVNEVAANSESVVAAEYRGLSVAQMTEFRVKARNEGVYVRVIKNTLAKRAIEGTDFECLGEVLRGPLLLAFSREDPGAAARVIKDFAKANEDLATKAVVIGGTLYGAEDLNRLASLPNLDQARAMLLGVLQAPLSQLVRTLAEPPGMLARVLGARGDAESST
ncbi:MAG: 50S ribosomal protein L10 [Gammaproteobacteria bacterium]|jgi:large subunit ribosomal protein L10|nr:50S ribosomal protein L10 [Chromatiales bacterium]MDP6675562.1 50S ribosomal protein L10 [Gammaproteobacteria bacterium]